MGQNGKFSYHSRNAAWGVRKILHPLFSPSVTPWALTLAGERNLDSPVTPGWRAHMKGTWQIVTRLAGTARNLTSLINLLHCEQLPGHHLLSGWKTTSLHILHSVSLGTEFLAVK